MVNLHSALDAFSMLQLPPRERKQVAPFFEVSILLRELRPEEMWKQMLAAPMKLPAQWRYGRLDDHPSASVSPFTLFVDRAQRYL